MLVVGYKGGIRKFDAFTDMNPVFRHNFVFAHQVHAKLRHLGEDEEVSTTPQKNERGVLHGPDHLPPRLFRACHWGGVW